MKYKNEYIIEIESRFELVFALAEEYFSLMT